MGRHSVSSMVLSVSEIEALRLVCCCLVEDDDGDEDEDMVVVVVVVVAEIMILVWENTEAKKPSSEEAVWNQLNSKKWI